MADELSELARASGVAKATLYSAFGSKEGLVRAYLQDRHAATQERMNRELQAHARSKKLRASWRPLCRQQFPGPRPSRAARGQEFARPACAA